MRIAFMHPDLGIGGAERLVVEAALGLQEAGHAVTVFATRYDPARALSETLDGRLALRVYGNRLPVHVLHRFRAPCAIARMHYLACRMALCRDRFDVIVCDLVAHVVPLLRALCRTKVVFYCHYPDRLLARPRSFAYAAYRRPIDALEAIGIRSADHVLVNSQFTAGELRMAVPELNVSAPEVVYPSVDCSRYALADAAPMPSGLCSQLSGWPNPADAQDAMQGTDPILLCLSRYDASKNLQLAIDTLAVLRSYSGLERVRLVVAGGYDAALRENEEVFRRLVNHARARRLTEQVIFLRSIADAERLWLLARCVCVAYTPLREHFGLVPLEAMAARRPVVAVEDGGVRETVVHGETGFLCAPTAAAFAEAVRRILQDSALAVSLGKRGRAHVESRFSRRRFTSDFEAVLRAVVASEPEHRSAATAASRNRRPGKSER
jgi:alpha-1,3/alpha-1,6-mannosyltransferase